MQRDLMLWLSALAVVAVVAGGAAVTYATCPGCLPRDRVNTRCAWTGDTAYALDARNAVHDRHLVEDAQLAEELAIRYADAEFGRRSGFDHHGGLLENGRLRNGCLARMFQAIEQAHAVPPDRVEAARGVRNRAYDAAVALLFVPFYALAAVVACRGIARRFGPDERVPRAVATAVVSVAAALAGAVAFRLWGGVWEAIRVGNGHMTTIRAASYSAWIHTHVGIDVAAGLLVFWLVAAISAARAYRSGRRAALPG